MAFRSDIVIVAILCMLRAGAPARFPDLLSLNGWWPNTDHVQDSSEIQVVYLPALLPREAHLAADDAHDVVPVQYSFDAFGRNFDLQLVPNRRLVSPEFRVWTDRGQEAKLSTVDTSCHFLHTGPDTVAAFSACRDHTLHGLIVVDNSTYEVRPLAVGASRAEKGGSSGRTAHVIRRAPPPTPPGDDARPLRPRVRRRKPRGHLPHIKPGLTSYTIEIALFLDEAAYKIFYPFLNYNEADLRDMLLAYINGVQALYQHSSLGTHIQLSLVRLTLLRAQPPSLSAHAERGRLLDSFCAYQRSLNVEDDDDPQHWDMALLLSGLDFYSEEGGHRNGVTMGLAPVGGVCLPAHACVVSEFGTSDLLGRPYPSAGFTSVYILAHEIGHNLGMHHDGTGNSCARDGYIMSPSRGTNGEASWSSCSARVAAELQWATCLLDGAEEDDLDVPSELQHERFGGGPGAVWNVKKQCEVLLRDKDAAATLEGAAPEHCAQLACRTPHRVGFYYAGPALPGTPCGHHMWCQGGECVPAGDLDLPTTSDPTIKPDHNGVRNSSNEVGDVGVGDISGWSTWNEASCRSGCTERSRGFRERRRVCMTQNKICHGSGYDVVLCDDTKVCGKKSRVSANELASRKCSEYAALLPELDARGGGLQAPHDPTRMWMGCAVFCRRASGGGFYAPRVEINNVGKDPYFPDGTWCHNDGGQDYYCMQHHCLPELGLDEWVSKLALIPSRLYVIALESLNSIEVSFKMAAQWHIWELPDNDVRPFNARALNTPVDEYVAASVHQYDSLDDAGVPLLRGGPLDIPPESGSNWEVLENIPTDERQTWSIVK